MHTHDNETVIITFYPCRISAQDFRRTACHLVQFKLHWQYSPLLEQSFPLLGLLLLFLPYWFSSELVQIWKQSSKTVFMFCMYVPCCRPLLVILQWTFPLHRKLREQDVTIFHIQLCIALFCMLIVFVCGINQTSVYGGCVLVSVLIHYFTLVAVMFMGAEAVLLFQKLIIVFGQTTAKFFISVSLIGWCECILVTVPLTHYTSLGNMI